MTIMKKKMKKRLIYQNFIQKKVKVIILIIRIKLEILKMNILKIENPVIILTQLIILLIKIRVKKMKIIQKINQSIIILIIIQNQI